MTVSYQRNAATANGFTFLKLLFRWRGSVWKLVHFEFLVYLILYNLITFLDNIFLAPNDYGEYFADLVYFCRQHQLTLYSVVGFVMTFYTVQIYDRWWSVYTMLPWPDNLCFQISSLIKERGPEYKAEDEDVRKRICRYLCLCYVMVFRDISERIKSRFPTLSHLEGSLITKKEVKELEGILAERVNWVPIEWVVVILKELYKLGRITDVHYSIIITSLMNYRERLHNIMQYDTVNLPLIYTQAVFFVTYFYFAIELFAIQRPKQTLEDMYWMYDLPTPLTAIIEFPFLIGWLRSAEVMINPLGTDDDDFDLDLLIERNFYISFNIVEWAIRRKPKKEDIAQEMEQLPKRNFESMVEDHLRPQNWIGGSAVPLPKKQIICHTPDVENQYAKFSKKFGKSGQETDNKKKSKSKPKILLGWRGKAHRVTKEESQPSKARRLRTPHASRVNSKREKLITGSAGPIQTTPEPVPAEPELVEPGNLREKLEFIQKVGRKRDQMEEEWTQYEEDEELPAESAVDCRMKTPKPSRNPSKTMLSARNTPGNQAAGSLPLAPTPETVSKTQTPESKPLSKKSALAKKTSAQQLEKVVEALKAREQKKPPEDEEKPKIQ